MPIRTRQPNRPPGRDDQAGDTRTTSSMTGFDSSVRAASRPARGRVGHLALDLELEPLALAGAGELGEAEPGQGAGDGLALRVEDLGLRHDVDDDASHRGLQGESAASRWPGGRAQRNGVGSPQGLASGACRSPTRSLLRPGRGRAARGSSSTRAPSPRAGRRWTAWTPSSSPTSTPTTSTSTGCPRCSTAAPRRPPGRRAGRREPLRGVGRPRRRRRSSRRLLHGDRRPRRSRRVGGRHAVIHAGYPPDRQRGLADRRTRRRAHPLPPRRHDRRRAGRGIDVLAVPINAPWAAMKETVEFVRAARRAVGLPDPRRGALPHRARPLPAPRRPAGPGTALRDLAGPADRQSAVPSSARLPPRAGRAAMSAAVVGAAQADARRPPRRRSASRGGEVGARCRPPRAPVPPAAHHPARGVPGRAGVQHPGALDGVGLVEPRDRRRR